ncbi:MAG: hypothetical protein ACYCXN_15615, partial [Acidimicrobiales bacterium]
MRPHPFTRSRVALAGGAVALTLGLSACSSGLVVASRADRFYLRLPSGWKTYYKSQLLSNPKWSMFALNPPRVFLAATGGPHPNISQPLSSSNYPWAVLV